MSKIGGIILLIVGGFLVYTLLSKTKLANVGTDTIQNSSTIKISDNNAISLASTNKNIEPSVTPQVITQLKSIIPNLQGSQVSNLIHGGSINLGYKGTNFKYYKDYCEAWRNGAVPNFNPDKPSLTRGNC